MRRSRSCSKRHHQRNGGPRAELSNHARQTPRPHAGRRLNAPQASSAITAQAHDRPIKARTDQVVGCLVSNLLSMLLTIGIAGPPHSGGFANHQLYRHRALRGVGEPWRYFASNTRVIRRQGNNWLTIAAPPAVRIAPLRTRAKRRFGSSLSTATNKNAPAKQIAKTYRRTITAIKSGNLALSGQDLLAADE